MTLKVLLVIIFVPTFGLARSLETVVSWKIVDFGFFNEEDLNHAYENGQLNNQNADLFDVDVAYKDNGERSVFVTVPRFKEGIPYSLAAVVAKNQFNNQSNEKIITPYPSYFWHANFEKDCDGINSAIRIAIDQCHRLWVLDTGLIGTKFICPPKILVFDLNTDTLIHRYTIPKDKYKKDSSRLVNLIVDILDPPPNGLCSKTFAFIADTGFHGLIVYDVEQNFTWRIENKFMYPDPDFGTFSIAGEKVDIMDGILGMSITPLRFPGERFFYFNSLSGEIENAISLKTVLNRTIWEKGIKVQKQFFQIGRRGVQCSNQAIDSKGNIYCVTMDEINLISWKIRTPYEYNQFKILANDNEQLQFATGIKVKRNKNGQEELWILTSRYQRTLARRRNFDDVNFRILVCNLDNLEKWNTCRIQRTWKKK